LEAAQQLGGATRDGLLHLSQARYGASGAGGAGWLGAQCWPAEIEPLARVRVSADNSTDSIADGSINTVQPMNLTGEARQGPDSNQESGTAAVFSLLGLIPGRRRSVVKSPTDARIAKENQGLKSTSLAAAKDPLRWFAGGLVPPALRSAQSDFATGEHRTSCVCIDGTTPSASMGRIMVCTVRPIIHTTRALSAQR
jgi:hypothetical protein